MTLRSLRSSLVAKTILGGLALVGAQPAAALAPAVPSGAVFVILPGATITQATVAMQMPNGVPIPIGMINPTTGLFTPSGVSGSMVTAMGGITPLSEARRAALRIDIANYGAVCDGNSHTLSAIFPTLAAAQAVYPQAVALTDEVDGTAIQFAIGKAFNVGGGTVDIGTGNCLTSNTILETTNVSLRGRNVASSIITGARSLPAIVSVGNATVKTVNAELADLTVQRAAGKPPVNSIGVSWANFGYGHEVNTLVQNNYFDRAWDYAPNPTSQLNSVSYRGDNTYAADAVQAYGYMNNAADIFLSKAEWGRNGGELYNPAGVMQISGQANDLVFTDSVLIPRGPTANSGTVLNYVGYLSTTGIFKISNVLTENTSTFIQSDANTPRVNQLFVDNSRLSISTDFSALNAATLLSYSHITGTDVGGGPTTLTNTYAFRITGGSNIQNLNLSGQTATGTFPNDAMVTDSYFGTVKITGIFGSVLYANNLLSTGGTFTDNSTASNKTIQAGALYQVAGTELEFATKNGIGLQMIDPSPRAAAAIKNTLCFKPGLTTIGPVMQTCGEANTPFALSANGTNAVLLMSQSATANALSADAPVNGKEWIRFHGAVAGGMPYMDVGSNSGTANLNVGLGARGTGSMVFTTPTAKSAAAGISAAGTSLATATLLTKDINVVTTVASGAGVSLPAYPGMGAQKIDVLNRGANALAVYPATSSGMIEAQAAGNAYSIPSGGHATFECVSATQCYQTP